MSAIFGELLTYPQENGPDVQLYTFGDEFYARRETVDGDTAVYDQDLGVYCYAEVMGGKFTSTGISVTMNPPNTLRRQIKESPGVRNAKFERRYELMGGKSTALPPDVSFTLGRENGLLEGRQLNTGTVRGLTILVQFSDVRTSITSDDYHAMLNASGYSVNGNFCSVRSYYSLMSSGKLDYHNDVFGPITLPKRRSHYESKPLMEEALRLALDEYNIDFGNYDSENEGIVDALSFVYAGRTVYKDWLWPHNYKLDLTIDGYDTNLYTIQSAGRSVADLSIGTFCHEAGHQLCRFPDLYDYGKRDGDFEKSSGLGRYCLMSSGNHLNRGRTPAPICAYLRLLAGWYDEIVDLSRDQELTCRHGDYGTIYKFPTDFSNEYFLVENRFKTGLDSSLPASGLAIYHCDILGSNEWQDGTAEEHYQAGLLQADGHLDLESNRNVGDSTDLFDNVDGIAISRNTNPASMTWDGSDSGFIVSDISEAAKVMTFRVGGLQNSEPMIAESDALTVDVELTEGQNQQVAMSVPVRTSSTVDKVTVGVEGFLSEPTDLSFWLEGPDGDTVELGHVEPAEHDFEATFEVDRERLSEAMSSLESKGVWKVQTRSAKGIPAGRFHRVKVEMG